MPAEIRTDCKSVDTELDQCFAQSAPVMSPQARQHLNECKRCRDLYEYLAQASPPGPASPELERRIVEDIHKSLQPVSRLRSISGLTAQLSMVFLLAALALTGMMKQVGWTAMSAGQVAGISAILALGVVLLSRSLAWQMTPGSPQRIQGWAAIAILGGGLLVGMILLFPWRTPEAFVLRGMHCLRVGLALAAPAAALFCWMARRGAALNLTIIGATLGAIAGLLAVTILQFTCNLQDFAHLVTWHGGVFAISALLGAIVGRIAGRFHRTA